MKLSAPDYIVLIVTELERALDFYTDVLGLTLVERSGPFAQLWTGKTRLALYEREAMAVATGLELQIPASDAPGFELGFVVEDVDAAFRELQDLGVEVASPPADRLWGQRGGLIRDPDGHLIELIQNRTVVNSAPNGS
jgi:catechol 2,3-dioxygenase-like lactoylglutathione lyase family enzyme